MIKTTTLVHQDENISVTLPDIHERLLAAVKSGSHEAVILEMQNHILTTRERKSTNPWRPNRHCPEIRWFLSLPDCLDSSIRE